MSSSIQWNSGYFGLTTAILRDRMLKIVE